MLASKLSDPILWGTPMLATLLCLCVTFRDAQADEMPGVQVAKDKKSFALEQSGKPFLPWGFNYDHDSQGQLIEDYWDKEWDKVEAHFRQMKKLGATVVRIHLQVGKFMDAAGRAQRQWLDRLLLGQAAGRVTQLEHDPGRHDAGVVGVVREKSAVAGTVSHLSNVRDGTEHS